MNRQIFIYNVRYKPTAGMKDASVLFLVPALDTLKMTKEEEAKAYSKAREDWKKTVRGADEDLDLRTSKWVGSTFGNLDKVAVMNFDVDVFVNTDQL